MRARRSPSGRSPRRIPRTSRPAASSRRGHRRSRGCKVRHRRRRHPCCPLPSPSPLVRREDPTRKVAVRGRWVAAYGEVITLIWTILALVCIVLGFVGELVDERILMGTLEWFVAAIAFNSLGGLPGVFAKRRG